MDTFDGVEMFVRVAETGSFTRAAEVLGVGKSVVSDGVRRLEGRLGVRLLERTTRRVTVTEAGQAYYAHCRRALEEAMAARAEARSYLLEPQGRFRIAAPDAFAAMYIIPILPRLLLDYPGLSVELDEGTAPVNLVEAGFDLAIRITPAPAETLVTRRLGTSRVIAVASPDYLRRFPAPAAPEDILNHRLIGFTPLFWAREWRFAGPSGEFSIPVTPALTSHNTDTMRFACLAGVGIAPVPDWLVREDIRRGDLVEVLSDWSHVESGVYAVYPSNRQIAGRVKVFVDRLAHQLKAAAL